MNQIDNIKLLEYKLHQDHLALKKILKWEEKMQKRIEQTKLQLQTLKQDKSIFLSKQIQCKSSSKIPVPVHKVCKIVSKSRQQVSSNIQNLNATNTTATVNSHPDSTSLIRTIRIEKPTNLLKPEKKNFKTSYQLNSNNIRQQEVKKIESMTILKKNLIRLQKSHLKMSMRSKKQKKN